jgi:glycosyltransferase involved in cell wall biosynthesis
MRILLVTTCFLPEPHRLLAELATTLHERGHHVAVLTGFPHWPAGKLYPEYKIRLFAAEEIESIPIYRVPMYPDHSSSALKRMVNAMSFALSATLVAPWRLPRFDVIHAISPLFTMLPAWLLSRIWRVPFTYDVEDMFPESLASTGMLSNPLILGLIGQFAKVMYGRAAAIRVVSPGFRLNLERKGVPPERIHVISNWVDTELYRALPHNHLVEDSRLQGKLNVMFAGNVGLAQGLEVVLRAAQLLTDLPVNFVIVGDGVDLPRLKRIQDQERIGNVIFLGRFDPEEMPLILCQADVLLAHLRDDPLFRVTIPHKILTYLAAGRPILAAVTGDSADIIRNTSAGVVCEPDNPQTMATAVRMLYSLPRTRLEQFGYYGRSAACSMYSKEHLIAEVDAMLREVVGPNHHQAMPQLASGLPDRLRRYSAVRRRRSERDAALAQAKK